jgi:hypothetical protein
MYLLAHLSQTSHFGETSCCPIAKLSSVFDGSIKPLSATPVIVSIRPVTLAAWFLLCRLLWAVSKLSTLNSPSPLTSSSQWESDIVNVFIPPPKGGVRDFGTMGLEQTRYAPIKPTIKPCVKIYNGRQNRSSSRFTTDGKAGPGERLFTTDQPNVVKVVKVTDERVVTSRRTVEGSRSKLAGHGHKVERFIMTNGRVDRKMDTTERLSINPGPTSARKHVEHRRRLVRPI